MDLSEILEIVNNVAEEREISPSDLLNYRISITIDGDNTTGLVSDIMKDIDIDEDEQIIYVTIQLY